MIGLVILYSLIAAMAALFAFLHIRDVSSRDAEWSAHLQAAQTRAIAEDAAREAIKEELNAINQEMDNAGVPVADDSSNIVFFKGIPCALKTGFYTAPEDDPKFKFISGSVRLSDE